MCLCLCVRGKVVEGLIVGGPRRDRLAEAGNGVSEGQGHDIAGAT